MKLNEFIQSLNEKSYVDYLNYYKTMYGTSEVKKDKDNNHRDRNKETTDRRDLQREYDIAAKEIVDPNTDDNSDLIDAISELKDLENDLCNELENILNSRSSTSKKNIFSFGTVRHYARSLKGIPTGVTDRTFLGNIIALLSITGVTPKVFKDDDDLIELIKYLSEEILNSSVAASSPDIKTVGDNLGDLYDLYDELEKFYNDAVSDLNDLNTDEKYKSVRKYKIIKKDFANSKRPLTLAENKLIFGNLLENLNEISNLLEAADQNNVIKNAFRTYTDVITSSKVNQHDKNEAKLKQNLIINNATKQLNADINRDGIGTSSTLKKNKDVLTSETIKEEIEGAEEKEVRQRDTAR